MTGERETQAPDIPIARSVSPDGSITIEYAIDTGRMSHEIRQPTIIETASGRRLLSLGDGFDGSERWLDGSSFDFALRNYYRAGALLLRIEPREGRFSIPAEGSQVYPLERLQEEAERAFERAFARIPATSPAPAPRLPSPRLSARHVLLGIGIAFAAIAIIAAVAVIIAPQPKQRVAPLPKMQAR